jgi:hypothetical protein
MLITLCFPYVSTTPRAIAMGITRGVYQVAPSGDPGQPELLAHGFR